MIAKFLSAQLAIHNRSTAGVGHKTRPNKSMSSARHSVKRRQPEELWLKVLHAPKPYCGLQSEAPVQVVVRHHHHLHAGGKRRLHAVGCVFEHQALGEGERERNPVSLLKAEQEKVHKVGLNAKTWTLEFKIDSFRVFLDQFCSVPKP